MRWRLRRAWIRLTGRRDLELKRQLEEHAGVIAARRAAQAPHLVGQAALVDTLTALLFVRDPMGIAFDEFGNLDEYSAEAETIAARRGEIVSIDDAREVVFETFSAWFGPGDVGSEEDYQTLAEDVWRAVGRGG